MRLFVDGNPVTTLPGTMLTAALVEASHLHFRAHPVTGEPRGPVCGMGICLECEVLVDGYRNVRACITTVEEGMQVDTIGESVDDFI